MKRDHRRSIVRPPASGIDLGISLSVYGKSSDGSLVEIRGGDGAAGDRAARRPSATPPTKH